MSIIQTSCSELLVDTAIHDPEVAFERFNPLFSELGWETSPPLTLALLQKIKRDADREGQDFDVTVFDAEGNRASLEYGGNGYITTGYRFDTNCNDWDVLCFPIFREAIERLGAELVACDGGGTGGYEKWATGKEIDEEEGEDQDEE